MLNQPSHAGQASSFLFINKNLFDDLAASLANRADHETHSGQNYVDGSPWEEIPNALSLSLEDAMSRRISDIMTTKMKDIC